MYSDWRFWFPALLAILALTLTGFNTVLRQTTLRSSQQLAERQAYIAQSQQLSQVNQALIQALANAAAQVNDPDLHALLEQQGITYTVSAPTPTPTPAPSATGDSDE